MTPRPPVVSIEFAGKTHRLAGKDRYVVHLHRDGTRMALSGKVDFAEASRIKRTHDERRALVAAKLDFTLPMRSR